MDNPHLRLRQRMELGDGGWNSRTRKIRGRIQQRNRNPRHVERRRRHMDNPHLRLRRHLARSYVGWTNRRRKIRRNCWPRTWRRQQSYDVWSRGNINDYHHCFNNDITCHHYDSCIDSFKCCSNHISSNTRGNSEKNRLVARDWQQLLNSCHLWNFVCDHRIRYCESTSHHPLTIRSASCRRPSLVVLQHIRSNKHAQLTAVTALLLRSLHVVVGQVSSHIRESSDK